MQQLCMQKVICALQHYHLDSTKGEKRKSSSDFVNLRVTLGVTSVQPECGLFFFFLLWDSRESDGVDGSMKH